MNIRFSSFLLFIVFFNVAINAQETILIPDIGLEECLIDLDIDSNGLNGNILVSDAKYVINLNINNPITNKLLPNVHSKIKDLTGLESFPNLKRLDCFNNNLTKLDLSKSTSITFLNCNDNKITKLDLSKNTKLAYVSCDNNQLNTLLLGDNPNLESLYSSFNTLTYLDVSGCSKLESLDTSGNDINMIRVNNTQLNTPPQGWYKDEKTIYSTTKIATKPTIKSVTESVTKLTNSTVIIAKADKKTAPIIKNNTEKTIEMKQQIVAEFEAEVLNELHLNKIKNKVLKKYSITSEELSEWLKKYNKRIDYSK
ncbi:hypothetical protein F7647_00980 [Tenacibaculum piscium]|uniref:hypothetical protein n=1 Tax=Tenacibaculum piscium TaxID=1458515 RepID=UPI00187B47CF|nr:hypothetical protein [Tenacibaculum piscium]MBE7684644.1 hypothetical protein [Tenacibaculum piscium]MBE7689264.1 hypothetical protein [Tenacibaculum piscium]